MLELSHERIEQIVLKETPKTEVLPSILRSVYVRYMSLYEKYFTDIDTLNDDTISELNKYNEETKSLVKYYYMDIPRDICMELEEFNDTYSAKLLGTDWHKTLFNAYRSFRDENESDNKSENCLKAEFSKQCLKAFYDAMDYIFRDGFGTRSKTAETVTSGLASMLFGEK